MKVVFEDGELDGISGNSIFDHEDPDREYSINFKVTNPEIAMYVLLRLMNSNDDEFNVGLDVTSINLHPFASLDQIKAELKEAVDRIIKY